MAENDQAKIDISFDTSKLKQQLKAEIPSLVDELRKAMVENSSSIMGRQSRMTSISRKMGGQDTARLNPDYVDLESQVKVLRQRGSQLRHEYEKEVDRIRRPTAGKKFKGIIQQLISGGDEPEDAEKAAKRALANLHNDIRHNMVMVQQITHSLVGPLPGGGLVMAGVSGLTNSYTKSRFGGAGALHALGKGLLGGLGSLGLAGLAAGVGASVVGSKENESILRTLARASGSPGEAYAANGAIRGVPGMTAREAAPIASQVLRSTGHASGIRAALRAQFEFGGGGEFANLLGVQASTGAFAGMTSKQQKSAALHELQSVFAAGTAQGLRNGRLPELIAGATAEASKTTLGVAFGGTTGVFGLAGALGQDRTFRGRRGFEAISALDNFSRGRSGGALGQALALQASGLGSGNSLVGSLMENEKGLFGKGVNAMGRVQAMLGGFHRAFGSGSGDRQILAFSNMTGMSLNASKRVLDLESQGKLNDTALQKVREGDKSAEQKAYEAMASMPNDWKNIDKDIEDIAHLLGEALKDSGALGVIAETIKDIDQLLRAVLGKTPNGPAAGGSPVKDEEIAKQLLKGKFVRNGLNGKYLLFQDEHGHSIPSTPSGTSAENVDLAHPITLHVDYELLLKNQAGQVVAAQNGRQTVKGRRGPKGHH